MFKEKKPKSKKEIHRNTILVGIVLGICEVLFIYLIIANNKPSLIWAPILILALFATEVFFDIGKIKDLEEENKKQESQMDEEKEDNNTIVENQTKNENE